MPDRLRRMPVTPKMNSLQREVGRDQRVVSRGRPQHGAVIPDPGHNRPHVARAPPPACRRRLSPATRRISSISAFSGSGTKTTTIAPRRERRPHRLASPEDAESRKPEARSRKPEARTPAPMLFPALSPQPGSNLSAGDPWLPAFSNRKWSFALVDRGNPVCYR